MNEHSHQNGLKDTRPSLLRLCIPAIAVSLLYIFTTYAPGFLSGKGEYWDFRTDDAGIHLTGMRYYIHDDWRWPLCNVQGINYPEGSNIIFTDSLPLMSFIAKIVYKASGFEWNFFGFWTIFQNLALAISVVLLLDSVGVRSYLIAAAASALALCNNEFIFRSYYHVALGSTFVIILALTLYFHAWRKPDRLKTVLLAFLLLLVSCLLIHFYLFVMAYAIFAATLITAWTSKYISGRACAFWFAESIVAVTMVGVSVGYLHLDGSMKFTHAANMPFGLNLVEPFYPNQFSVFYTPILEDHIILGTNIRIAYVGAGVLLLWLYVVGFHFKQMVTCVRRHKWFFLILLAMYIFSLGRHVRFADCILFRWPMLPGIRQVFETFRATDRFAWPILLMSSLAPLFLFAQPGKHRRLALVLLLSVLVLQNVDIWKFRAYARNETRYGSVGETVYNQRRLLDHLVRSRDSVVIDKSADALDTHDKRMTAAAVYFLAGKHNAITNYSRTARAQRERLTTQEIVDAMLPLDRKVLYVLSEKTFSDSPLRNQPVAASLNGLVLLLQDGPLALNSRPPHEFTNTVDPPPAALRDSSDG